MHSDSAEIKKSIRSYMMVGAALLVFTVITVAVNQIHLSSVALAITIALIIASTKASMVGAIFMHLSHERKWIYGSLILTAFFFIVLMTIPALTIGDGIGTPIHTAAPAEHRGGTLMGLRHFHLFFIGVSVVLAVFVATWAAGQSRADHGLAFAATTCAAVAGGVGLAMYGAKFQRRTRNL